MILGRGLYALYLAVEAFSYRVGDGGIPSPSQHVAEPRQAAF
jgi:hypothetical protein